MSVGAAPICDICRRIHSTGPDRNEVGSLLVAAGLGARNEHALISRCQRVLFVDEGTVAAVFAPGTYTLEAPNLPVLTDHKGCKYDPHSPFKAEVYFVSTFQAANAIEDAAQFPAEAKAASDSAWGGAQPPRG